MSLQPRLTNYVKVYDQLEHAHTILNEKTGYTDPGPDGHRHRLIRTGCMCNAVREFFRYPKLITETVNEHHHEYLTIGLKP